MKPRSERFPTLTFQHSTAWIRLRFALERHTGVLFNHKMLLTNPLPTIILFSFPIHVNRCTHCKMTFPSQHLLLRRILSGCFVGMTAASLAGQTFTPLHVFTGGRDGGGPNC